MSTTLDSINIVRLDGIIGPSPIFDGILHQYTEYLTTPPNDSIISERLQNADVVVTTKVPITDATITACPKLKLVAVLAIGYDHVDLKACKDRGVSVCNVPAASNEAVAEHAIAMFFALRRNLILMHELTVKGEEWIKKGSCSGGFASLPGTCRSEIMAVIGAGQLGSRVANIGRALGMKVILTERRDIPRDSVREGRVHFEEALKLATVFMLTLPLEPSTWNLITVKEFALMRPEAILINVARGGIVNEVDLVEALKSKRIAGSATDVFIEEPAGKESVLIRAANEDWAKGKLVLSPHLAWYAQSSMDKLRRTTTENVEAWMRGMDLNLVVHGGI